MGKTSEKRYVAGAWVAVALIFIGGLVIGGGLLDNTPILYNVRWLPAVIAGAVLAGLGVGILGRELRDL